MKLTLLNLNLLILTFIVNVSAFAQGNCGCDHTIGINEVYVDGQLMGVGPGDVVCIAAGTRRYLGLKNFQGGPGNPIIFKNCGGQVLVQNTDWYYAIRIDNSKYFKFTGTGDGAYEYGIKVGQTTEGISGLNIGMMSTDFEVDHVEVTGTGFAGIMAKTDPDCAGNPNRGNFVMKNISIHDNYVHDVGAEGIYIGFPHYGGIKRLCGSDSIRVFPHDITGLRIFRNHTQNTGREGLQVGCAVSDVEIYGNLIEGFGQSSVQWQRSGVHISTGTTGKFFNNIVKYGTGSGIWLNGYGENYIVNNIMRNVGSSGDDAIMVHDSLIADSKGYHIINNTIVDAGNFGLNVFSERSTAINFKNNIVSGTGSLMSVPSSIALSAGGNVHDQDSNNMFFEDYNGDNFHLTAISPAVDAGEDVSSFGVTVDYDFIKRPRMKAYDAGAFESPYERMEIGFWVFPNPVQTNAHIEFVIAEDTEGDLKVLDMHGREVAIIAQGPFLRATKYKFDFTATFAHGMYFYVLEGKDKLQVLKILHVSDPEVSIVIPAYNEEKDIIKTLSSISRIKTKYKTELVVANNNSKDRTQEILDRLEIRSVFAENQGISYARQAGLEAAIGKYILNADSDSIYPSTWVDPYVEALKDSSVSCVYGTYSFIPSLNSRATLAMYEMVARTFFELKRKNRECVNVMGFNFAFRKEDGIKVGGYNHNLQRKITGRSEDGWMALTLMKAGKIQFLRTPDITVWTSDRRLMADGSLGKAFSNRVKKEITRLGLYFKPTPAQQ